MKDTWRKEKGIALLGAMMLLLILALLGAMLLNLAGQESLSAAVGREAAVGQHLADAAAELVVAAFNNPHGAPAALVSALNKKSMTASGVLSFFDDNGRSQFAGTPDRPDLALEATELRSDRILNDPQTGLFRGLREFGTIEELKVYAASKPGLLCTVEATVRTAGGPALRQSMLMQLAALGLPALRSGVQVGQSLGAFQAGKESPVSVHWGDVKVQGNAVFRRIDEVPVLSAVAPVMGQGYDDTLARDDRWMELWIGGQAQTTQPVSVQGQASVWPYNVHAQQSPIPGVRGDEWPYEQLKQMAKQFGRYFAIDQAGLLYPQGVVRPGYGVTASEVLRSEAPGDQRGLIFIDTLDQQPPRLDNLGTIVIDAGYIEGLLVVQGHVLLSPSMGQSLAVLSPPIASDTSASRVAVQLSRININGVLYAGGDITVSGKARLFGAVVAKGTITPSSSGGSLEVWYNHDIGQALYQGLPVVYRAPGTWMMKY
jgi:hypothetical protein